MTNTYTQDEAVRDILRITLDSSIRPLSQTHGDQVREILGQLIATTRRETVEECYVLVEDRIVTVQEMGASSDYKSGVVDIFMVLKKHLDQLPDKQEV